MNLQQLTDQQLSDLFEQTKTNIAQYKNTQQALKILLNGGYGSLSNEHNRWYSDDIAESITLSGQLSARWIIVHVNKFFNQLYQTDQIDYVIAVDTDSIHLNVEPLIRKVFGDQVPSHEQKMTVLENFSKKMDQVIAEGYQLLAEELNVYESAMNMKLETICQAIWTGKKHYVMNVWANEGIRYNPPKMKIVGLEAVKSSTAKVVREWMKQALALLFDDDSSKVKQFIEQKRQQYCQMSFEQVAQPRSITDVDKNADPATIYGKGCPIHVRAALLYNHELEKRNLQDQLQPIRSGDKIRFCYMKLPNPIHENVFAVPDELPEQLQDLNQYIDYQLQFDKTFVDPITAVAEAAGMSLSDNISINQFFE